MSTDGGRHETFDERMDRNWGELLQELRVLQTGTQILAGFLLTLPFQSRFTEIDPGERTLFLVAISLAVLTTVLLLAPVSIHRALFRQHRKERLVRAAHVLARAGLVSLGLTMATVLALIFSVVVGPPAGYAAAAVSAVLFTGLWLVLPAVLRGGASGSGDTGGGDGQANRDGSPAPSRTTSA